VKSISLKELNHHETKCYICSTAALCSGAGDAPNPHATAKGTRELMTAADAHTNPRKKRHQVVVAMPAYDHTCDDLLGEHASAVPASYFNGLISAGAVPLIVPIISDQKTIDALMGMAHGLMLIGGPDIAPSHFGQTSQPGLRQVTPARDAVELRLTKRALADKMPIFAICRGIQVLNVAAGGSLFQDIASQRPNAQNHDRYPDHGPCHPAHPIKIEADSRIAAICGQTRMTVNSLHHQAIDRVGAGLSVVARSSDGIIEAIESKDDRWVVGVQWHPEWLLEDREDMPALFHAFCDACRSHAGRA
jgi:putative glutamine amidotransferase